MTAVSSGNPRRTALLVAIVLFVSGAFVGIVADRVWLGHVPPSARAEPLSVAALSRSLNLDADAEAKVRAVIDTLEPRIAEAAAQGPAALQSATRQARAALEDALPADRRPAFRSWMDEHHSRMMQMMGRTGAGMMMGGDTGGGGPAPGGGMMQGRSGMQGMMNGAGGGMMGRAVPQPVPAELPDPESDGANLLRRDCAVCHALPTPSAHTTDEWPAVVRRMEDHMRAAGQSLPPRADVDALLRYLEAHARR